MTPREGDVFTISLKDGREALCRVLYASSYFKNVVLVGYYGTRLGESLTSKLASTEPKVAMYTGWSKAWVVIGHEPLVAQERLLSRRVVAGDVWEGDLHLGPATQTELASLSKMDVYGHRILMRRLEAYV